MIVIRDYKTKDFLTNMEAGEGKLDKFFDNPTIQKHSADWFGLYIVDEDNKLLDTGTRLSDMDGKTYYVAEHPDNTMISKYGKPVTEEEINRIKAHEFLIKSIVDIYKKQDNN